MRHCIWYLIVPLTLTLVWSSKPGQCQIGWDESSLNIEGGYDQFQYGSFFLGPTFHLYSEEMVYVYMSHGLHYGYSPWSELNSISYHGDLSFYLLNIGLKVIGYTREGNTNIAFRPMIGYNALNRFKLNFGYNILSNNFHKSHINSWVFTVSIAFPTFRIK